MLIRLLFGLIFLLQTVPAMAQLDVYGELKAAQLEILSSDPSGTEEARIYFNSLTDVVKWYDGLSWRAAVDTNSTQTILNKTIDGDGNTVQDLPITAIKTNLTDASKFMVRDASGVPTSATKAVPTGDVVGTSDSQILTTKTIDGDDNTVQDLPITAIKTNLTDASKFMVRDASGVPTSSTKAVPTGDVLGSTDSQSVSNKQISSSTLASPTITGSMLFQNPSGAQPEASFSEDPDNGTNKVTIKAPATLSGDYSLELPPDDGDSGEVLGTNGSGVLDWVSPLTNPMTTQGDIIVGGSAGAATRLAIGTNGYIPQSTGTTLAYTPGHTGISAISSDTVVTDTDGVKIFYVTTGSTTKTTTSVNSSTETFTLNSHGMSDGRVLYVPWPNTITGGLEPMQPYFVISAAANTFQIATTPGGSAVNLTDTTNSSFIAGVTVTLPTATDNLKRPVQFYKADTGTGYLAVIREGSETIDGKTYQFLGYSGGFMEVFAEAASTWIVLRLVETGSFTPTEVGTTSDWNTVTISPAKFTRNKTQVHFAGRGTITNIDSTRHLLNLSMPFWSDLAATSDASGALFFRNGAAADTVRSVAGTASAVVASNWIETQTWPPATGAAGVFTFFADYEILTP